MHSEKINELRSELCELLEDRGTMGEVAEHFAAQQVEKMVEDGDAIELSEDEIRMLKEYRRYRETNASGVFSWQFSDEQPTFVVPDEPSLLIDPRNVSSM